MAIECNGLGAEEYVLYSLGVRDGEAAAEIRGHLSESCPACAAGVQRAAQLNAAIVFMLGQAQLANPPKRLRARILAAIAPNPAGIVGFWWRWQGAFAGSLALAAAIGVGWWLGREPATIRTVRLKDPIAEATWNSERSGLERQISELRSELSRRAGSPPVTAPPAATPPDPRLAEARSALENARQQAEASQSRARQLEEQIRQTEGQLASARGERQDAENRLAAAVRERNSIRQDLEKQLAAVQSRVRQLEVVNAGFEETLLRERQRSQQSLQLVQFFSSPSIEFVRLRSTQSGGKSAGHAFVAEGRKVLFYASNLPPLPAGRVYQLWLMRDQAPAVVSGGVFAAQQALVHEFTDAAAIRQVRALAVTDEPAGGSSKPTGRKFLVGTRT
ncbi:MAG: anti-sigma factor domain-containing protein [Bryobacteraceae bacterium]